MHLGKLKALRRVVVINLFAMVNTAFLKFIGPETHALITQVDTH